MKLLLSSLLIAALAALLAPAAMAQRSSIGASYGTHGYRGVGASYHSSGYASSRVWIPGRYESVSKRVFVPGPTQRIWVQPVYEWRVTFCGVRYVCAREGYLRTFQLPGRHETRYERVYVPGHWVARGSRG